MSILCVRLTHKYVGQYDYLDDWEEIGTVLQLDYVCNPNLFRDEDDICEPVVEKYLVWVESDKDAKLIRQALFAEYTKCGCGHEYDCCGCRSYRATEVKKKSDHIYQVVVCSSRNF